MYALIKGICEFHPRCQFSIPLWDQINRLDSADKELIAKLMFLVGQRQVNLSAFNLFNGCQTQWTFFETCTLPDPIPEFASPDLLSRPLSEHATVSWEKVLWKLSEALQDETLSQLSFLRAMLACRILITLEKNESCKGSLRLNNEGKDLLTAVLPCAYSSNRVWPASSILFYPIFDWMKRASMRDQALDSSQRGNYESAKKAGYKILEVRLKKYDTIELDLLPSSCRHKLTVQSTFDHSSGVFPVAPKVCTSCPASTVQTANGFTFQGGRKLYRIMHILQMFVTYVKHLSHGETPREMIVATVLYVLNTGASTHPMPLPMEYADETYIAITDHVEKHKPNPIKPPAAALDYRTSEGRHRRRKKRTGEVDIEMPSEVQTIQSYVESLKICQLKHGDGKSPRFQEECDAVAKTLTEEKETTLDIDLKKMPTAMRPVVRLSPERQNACASGKRKRPPFESDEEDDDDEDSIAPKTKSGRKGCELDGGKETERCPSAADVGRSRLPSQPNSVNDGSAVASKKFVPLSAAVSARVEKVVLEESKEEASTQCETVSARAPMQTDGDNGEENDCRSESNGASDSDSGDESGDESESESESESADDSENDSEEGGEQERNKKDEENGEVSATRPSPLNTPVRDVGDTGCHQLPTASPKKHTVEIPKMTLPLQVSPMDSKRTETRNLPEPERSLEKPDASCNQVTTVIQESQDLPTTSPDKAPSSLTQLPLTESIVEEVPPCVPPLQLQSQPRTMDFEESDVEELFNGRDGEQGTTHNWLDAVHDLPPTSLMDPVSSEILTRREPVKGQGNITVGPVSLDTAQRALCVTKIMREVGGLCDMVPPIELAHTFNGEVAFRVGTDQKQLYSLDAFPGDWTSLQSFPDLLRVIVMSAALQSLDPTDLSRFWITSEKRVVCLPSTTGRVEMKIHPMDLLLAVPDIGLRFRQAVRADVAGFAAWVRSITADVKGKIETIVREANLTTRDQSKTIDLDYFCRFFNNFVNVLPWIEGK